MYAITQFPKDTLKGDKRAHGDSSRNEGSGDVPAAHIVTRIFPDHRERCIREREREREGAKARNRVKGATGGGNAIYLDAP